MLELVLATRNKHKVEEFQQILKGVALVQPLSEFPEAPEVEETGSTFEANSILKAESAAAFTGKAALADDSGLEVDVLDGAPGVFSARYAGPAASNEDNNRKLLQELAGVPAKKRGGRFVCALALVLPGQTARTFRGVHEGVITTSQKGEGGFGYDPLFFSPELGATFAEVPMERKNAVSHRARALEKLRDFLSEV